MSLLNYSQLHVHGCMFLNTANTSRLPILSPNVSPSPLSSLLSPLSSLSLIQITILPSPSLLSPHSHLLLQVITTTFLPQLIFPQKNNPSTNNHNIADRSTTTTRPHPTTAGPTSANSNLATYLRQIHSQSPNSTQLVGILTLVISGGILLLLTGLTLTAVVLGLIFFAPIIILSSPLWLPIAKVLFLSVFGFLTFCGFGVAAVAAMSWVYRYYRGLHPPGSDRVDYARSRIATTAREVKDYAREYGGYLHSKVKDAAPGA